MLKITTMRLAGAFVTLLGIFIFQNCVGQATMNDQTLRLENLNSKINLIHWRQTSGALPPAYFYDTTYTVDFAKKSIIITSVKGESVKDQPQSGTKLLEDSQLSTLRGLLTKISYVNCRQGLPKLGAGLNEVSIYTISETSPELVIFLHNCESAHSEKAFQQISGYNELTAYLKSL